MLTAFAGIVLYKTVGFLLMCALSAWGIGWVVYDYVRSERERMRKDRNGQKMLKQAKATGAVAYWNANSGIVALCRAADLKQVADAYLVEVGQGIHKAYEAIRLMVPHTFTFNLRQGSQNCKQVGDELTFNDLVERIVSASTGYMPCDVNHWSYQRAKKILVPQHEQLFVPYSCSSPRPEEQEKFFGAPTLPEAQEHMLYFGAKS